MSDFQYGWFFTYLLDDPKVILDVGTYDGHDAEKFKRDFPECRVIAFEACPDNFAVMKSRGFHLTSGVEIHHAAMCDFDGEIPFFSNSDTQFRGGFGQSGSVLTPTDKIDKKWRGGTGAIKFRAPRMVPSCRLETFCAEHKVGHIDLLHMDVQGAESMVLDGMGHIRPTMIFLEIDETSETGGYVGCVTRAELVNRLTSRGYKLAWNSVHDALYVQP